MTNNTRVVATASIGVMIQMYNFVIYILFAPILAKIFYGTDDTHSLIKIYLIFAAGYFVRPIGGLIATKLGNTFGMKSVYLITIIFMAFSTVFLGSLPSSITIGAAAPYCLLFFRLLQGLAFGGDIPASITFVSEHLSDDKKMVGLAFVAVGVEFGLLLAACVAFIFTNCFTYEEIIVWGWRPPFFIGAILAAGGFYLRFILTDLPEFEEENDVCNNVKRISLINMIKNYKNEVIVSLLLNIGLGIYVSVFCLYFPAIMNRMYGLKFSVAYDYNICFIIVYILTTILAGFIVRDFKFSPRFLFITGVIFVGIFTFLVTGNLNSESHEILLIFYVMLACSLALCCAMIPFLMANIFDLESRFTGIAISYNIGQALGGGCTPIIIALIFYGNKNYSLTMLILIASLIILVGFILGSFLKNKKGKSILSN